MLSARGTFDRLEKSADVLLMKFSNKKFRALHLGRNHPKHQHTLRANWLESSFAEKDLQVLLTVDSELNMSQLHASAAGIANRS